MPRTLLLSVITILMGMPLAQAQVAVELEKMNIIYIGLRNPVNIVVQGYDKKELVYETTAGCQFVQTDSGDYLKAFERGDCKLFVKTKKGNVLDSSVLRVRSIPKPEARLGTMESGTYSAGAISAQPGVYATLGEGFGYEGIKYHIDSCFIQLITPFEVIQCHQKGTALHPQIKQHLSDVLEISITEIYASQADPGTHTALSPLIIQSSEPELNGRVQIPDFTGLPVLKTGECRIENNLRLKFMSNGRENRTYGSKGTPPSVDRFIHMIGNDTVFSIQQGHYRKYNDSGILIETGNVSQANDTVSGRIVEGEALYWRNASITFENDTTLRLHLRKRFYPVGEWSYYHPDGKLKALGKYRTDSVRKSDECIHVIDPTNGRSSSPSYRIHIRRSGTWHFYNEAGELIHTIRYPD